MFQAYQEYSMYDSNVSLPVDLSETETGILFLSIIA